MTQLEDWSKGAKRVEGGPLATKEGPLAYTQTNKFKMNVILDVLDAYTNLKNEYTPKSATKQHPTENKRLLDIKMSSKEGTSFIFSLTRGEARPFAPGQLRQCFYHTVYWLVNVRTCKSATKTPLAAPEIRFLPPCYLSNQNGTKQREGVLLFRYVSLDWPEATY